MLLVHVRYSKLSWNPRWQVFHYPEAKGEREKGGGGELTNSIKGNNIEEYEQQITILISSQTFMLPID